MEGGHDSATAQIDNCARGGTSAAGLVCSPCKESDLDREGVEGGLSLCQASLPAKF
ncbi:hypothetical protein GGTG_07226 [Gaeumannomyces tritici R3-111a-1]|uniref:Uncharacterized protein n=1 Tax=Gaeumannomyces tritici (strain R3-111a-1) TaxID=644352 RepID=J3P129_GAET3|nr:hypothetical protein GGTG_07226 [Gaeumannomyces tritici R3-111a-1]EJT77314.1 hypothetical protein GGTG_07226 [Gaeumannomyces tritici R3-111a-1]